MWQLIIEKMGEILSNDRPHELFDSSWWLSVLKIVVSIQVSGNSKDINRENKFIATESIK